jgi:hypothetical protein
MVGDALLRYLAVAHYGRGRGDYEESEHPEFWRSAVEEVTDRTRSELHTVWERSRGADAAALAQAIEALLARCATTLLTRLYPEAKGLFGAEPAAESQATPT